MSLYSGLAISVVHTRLTNGFDKMICEQSPLVHPNKIDSSFDSYNSFYDKYKESELVDNLKNRVLNMYRKMDDRMVHELAMV
jgi:transcription elongation factor Elf1